MGFYWLVWLILWAFGWWWCVGLMRLINGLIWAFGFIWCGFWCLVYWLFGGFWLVGLLDYALPSLKGVRIDFKGVLGLGYMIVLLKAFLGLILGLMRLGILCIGRLNCWCFHNLGYLGV